MIKINLKSSSSILKKTIYLFFFILLALPWRVAHADPADMYSQSQSILLNQSGLQLDWKISPGPVLAGAVGGAADQDQNGAISPQEAQAWVSPFLSDLAVMLDGQSLAPHQLQSIHWPAAVESLRNGQDAVEVSLLIPWPAGLTGRHSLQIHNQHLEANTLNWFSLTAQQGLAFDAPSEDNGLLSLK